MGRAGPPFFFLELAWHGPNPSLGRHGPARWHTWPAKKRVVLARHGPLNTSTCTGTGFRNLPRMWVFLPFFHMLIPKSTHYSHIHIKTPSYSSYNLYYTQFIFQYLSFFKNLSMNFSQNKSNMGHNPYTNKT